MQFITALKTILSLLPLIIQAVSQIEAAFPASGNGQVKLAALKDVLQSASDISDDVNSGQFDKLWPAIQRAVSAVVNLANVTGAFKK